MPSNRIRKEFNNGHGNWTAPAGVTQVNVQIIDKFDKLVQTRLAGGATNQSCMAIRRNGIVYGTGRNIFGQLGDNTTVSKSVLTPVSSGISFVQIIPGIAENSFGLRADQTSYGWGTNTGGELGDNTIVNKLIPTVQVGSHSFVRVVPSSPGAVALKVDGSAWSWNFNTNGWVGDNTTIPKSSPTLVVGGHSFINVSTYGTNTTAIKSDGSAWSWGSNTNGELGDGTAISKSSPVQVVGGHSFVSVFVGSVATHALKSDGTLWSWGLNSAGFLADDTTISKSSPVQAVGGNSFNILCSKDNVINCALKVDGSAWTWGSNTNGELGDGTVVPKSSPVAVLGGHSFIQVVGSIAFTAALKADGSVWCWGANNFGELGDNTSLAKSSPVQVVGGHSFIFLSGAGTSATNGGGVVGLKIDGTLWAWGRNLNGQLGDNTAVNKSSPVLMIGGLIFQTGSQIILEKTISVVPGTTYNMNVFLQNTNGVVIRSNPGNSLVVVLEYET